LRKRWQPATGKHIKLAVYEVSPDDGAGKFLVFSAKFLVSASMENIAKTQNSAFAC